MKTYSKETLEKKYQSLRKKVRKASDARNRAESMLDNLQKNKNLWKQMSDHCGFALSSNLCDWMA